MRRRRRHLYQPHPQGSHGRERPVAVDRGGQSAQGRGAECGADRRMPGQPQAAQGRLMAKGYWIARIDVEDGEAYESYVAAATPAYRKYGAQFLVRGGDI